MENLKEHINYKFACAHAQHTILEPISEPMIQLPAGTQICPERRNVNGEYYIALKNQVNVALRDGMCVTIDGVIFKIIKTNKNTHTNKKSVNNIHCTAPCIGLCDAPCTGLYDAANCNCAEHNCPSVLQSFVISKGTEYYIHDEEKDNVGLCKIIKVEDNFTVRPNSHIYLPKETHIVTTGPEKIHMTLNDITLCTM
jgi:hypothetical protein